MGAEELQAPFIRWKFVLDRDYTDTIEDISGGVHWRELVVSRTDLLRLSTKQFRQIAGRIKGYSISSPIPQFTVNFALWQQALILKAV